MIHRACERRLSAHSGCSACGAARSVAATRARRGAVTVEDKAGRNAKFVGPLEKR